MKQFDVILIDFPFIEDKTRSKVRPAVVISSTEYIKHTSFVLCAMITTAKNSNFWNDLKIKRGEVMGIENSIIRMKFANFTKDNILKKIGNLEEEDAKALTEKLSKILNI